MGLHMKFVHVHACVGLEYFLNDHGRRLSNRVVFINSFNQISEEKIPLSKRRNNGHVGSLWCHDTHTGLTIKTVLFFVFFLLFFLQIFSTPIYLVIKMC